MLRSFARRGFTLAAWSYPVALGIQIFFAGMYVFAGASNIELHRNFAHVIGVLTVLLLATAYVGGVSRADRRLTWAVVGLLAVQGGLVHVHQLFGAPMVAALHPVNAMVLAWVSVHLGRRASSYWTDESEAAVAAGRAGVVREPAAA